MEKQIIVYKSIWICLRMENPRNYVPHEKENRRGSTPISDSHPKECMQLKVGANMIKDA